MQERFRDLSQTIKLIVIIALAIVAAIIIWKIVAFVAHLLFVVLELVLIAAVIYAVFWFVWRNRSSRRSSTKA